MTEQITFKDWLKHRLPGVTRTQAPGSPEAKMMELLQESWDTSAVIEREACVLSCVAVADTAKDQADGFDIGALSCAEVIRGRGKKQRRGRGRT